MKLFKEIYETFLTYIYCIKELMFISIIIYSVWFSILYKKGYFDNFKINVKILIEEVKQYVDLE